MAVRRTIRIVEPTRSTLWAYSGSAMALVGVAAVAVAAVLLVAGLIRSGSFFDSRLDLSAAGDRVSAAPWGLSPAATRNAAIGGLFEVLLCGMGAVVVVAAISLASLFAARESQRTGEIAVRRAVGASRRLLVGSACLEASLLASAALILGGVVGVVVGSSAVGSWPGRVGSGSIVPSVAAVGSIGILFMLCAMLPWIFAPNRQATDATSRPVPLVLPALQLGLSLVVLTAAGLLTRHVNVRLEGQAALQPSGEVFRQTADDSAPAARASRYAGLLDALDAGKRFDTVSLTATGGLVGLGVVASVTTDCGQCSEGGIFLPWHVVTATHQFVSADTFQALGMHLLAGRGIGNSDRWGSTPIAVVSRSLALRHFQRGEAIGRKILLGDDARTWHTVVGIVNDAPAQGLGGSLQPVFTVYASVLQHPVSGVDLLLRPRGGVSVDATAIDAVAHGLVLTRSTRGRLSEYELRADELRPLRWFAGRIELEGWAALILACAGTFALIRLWIVSLLSELGLRRAVGARRVEVLAFVMIRAAGVGLGGAAVGVWFGPGVWKLLQGAMADSPTWDGGTVAPYALLLLSVVLLGALPPAVRAARTPPGRLLT